MGAHARVAPWLARSVRVSLLFCVCCGQKGIGSLNDPCDCMQHHDYWMSTKSSLFQITERNDFHVRIFNPNDALHAWMKAQSCMYSPENEEAHRPTALSDCIPGFIFTHIVCMQRHVVDRQPERVMAFAHELARLLPWGARCIDSPDGSSDSGWPFSSLDIFRYYRRVKKVFSVGSALTGPWPDSLLKEMIWKGGSVLQADRSSPNAALTEIDTSLDVDLGSEMLTPVDGDEVERIVAIHDAPEVCPTMSFPESGACWVLGDAGRACRDVCLGVGLTFHPSARHQTLDTRLGAEWEPKVTRLLMLAQRLPRLLSVQHPWAPFECYVAGENRFHRASTSQSAQDGLWSYPLCSLACPCRPTLLAPYREALERVPIFTGGA
eukprot:TRINITY_DN56636_c0_g1_i1.p1 TRINITY_DN56636_c0_g1~~TRINITY_DN56636_c0_g1_i1.p1  ORF type:complete len:396 (+),score=23.36 TRINITY_DN56636_c0_g1_i1:53-1189(+)